MKNLKFKLFMLVLMLLVSPKVTAYDFEIDGIYYDITSFTELTVRASSIKNTTITELVIPSNVCFNEKELIVNEIAPNFAANNDNLKSVNINVKLIGNGAFENCTSLNTVFLQDSVRYIGIASFRKCVKLKNIVLSDSILDLGASCFQECYELKNFEANNIERIGDYCFYGCEELRNVSLPKLSEISNFCFALCKKLNSCYTPIIDSIGNNAFQECSEIKEYIIPSTVSSIGLQAFMGSALSQIEIPNNVLSLMPEAFKNCDNLVYAKIGTGISTLYPIFEGCVKLQELIISDSPTTLRIVPYITADYKETYQGEYARATGSQITKRNGMFSDSNLQTLYIGRNLEQVIYSIERGEYFKNWATYGYQSGYCYNYYYYIYNSAFSSSPISKVTFGPQVTNFESVGDVGFVKGNLSIKGYDGDAWLHTTKEGHMYQDRITTTFHINGMFENCNSLEEVVFMGSSLKLPDYAFKNCNNLRTITLPYSTGNIGKESFKSCSSLKQVDFGNVKTIGAEALDDCNDLSDINFLSRIPPEYFTGFEKKIYISTSLKVPFGSLELYNQAEPWMNFWNKSEFPEVKAKEIILSSHSIQIKVNEKFKLKATILPEDTSVPIIIWDSSDDNIVEITDDGEIRGVASGKALITATCGDVIASCEVFVVEEIGFKDIYNVVTFDDMSVSVTEDFFYYVPEIFGPYNEEDFWLELMALDKDNRYPTQHVITISGGEYAGDYINYSTYMLGAGKYIFNLTSKGTNPNVVANPSRAYVTVNRASTNLVWNASSPIRVKVGEKVDLGISYQADLWCTFNTDYDKELISLSSEGATSRNPHWYATGLKEGSTYLNFSIDCMSNDFGFYDFSDSSTLYKEIIVSGYYEDGIEDVANDSGDSITVYNLQGVRMNVSTRDELHSLEPGLYIINGKKEFVR